MSLIERRKKVVKLAVLFHRNNVEVIPSVDNCNSFPVTPMSLGVVFSNLLEQLAG
jgi:hypothetical protein